MDKITTASFPIRVDVGNDCQGANKLNKAKESPARGSFLAELRRQVQTGEYRPDSRELAKTLVHVLVPPD